MSLLWTQASGDVRMVPIKEVMSYQPTDGANWDEVEDNYVWDHPKVQKFVQHVAEHGVKRPISVDYDESPPKVMDGHTRALAVLKAGHTHIPVKAYDWLGDLAHEGYEPFTTHVEDLR